jgi:hypothetical protein
MANNGTLYTVVQLIEYFEPSRTGVFYTDPAGDGSIQFNFGDGLDITTNGALAIGFISQALSDAGALPATIDTIVGDLNAYVSDNSLVTNNASELVSKLINLIMGLGIDVAELEQTVTGLYLQYESATKFNGIFSSIYPIPANVLSVVEDLVYTGGPGRIGASGIPGLNTALESANWGAAAYAIESDPVAQNYVDVPEGGYGLIYRRDAEAMIMLGFQVSLNGDNTINNISPIAVNNAAVVQYQQLFAANVPDSLDTTNNATIQSQIISYLSTQAYYVPQTSDGTTEPDIVASIISQFSSVMPSGITATTIENINSVFSDTSYTTGGLVHIPLASMSVSSITNLPLLPHGQTYVFDAATSMVYTLGASIDGSNSNALILDTQNPEGTYPAFDAGTYSNISYNSSTNTVGVTLVDDCGDPLGTLAFNTASGADTFTANDGYVITLPSTDTMHFTKINSDPLQGLINYISNLYDATQLEENDFNFLNPTGTAYDSDGNGQRRQRSLHPHRQHPRRGDHRRQPPRTISFISTPPQ